MDCSQINLSFEVVTSAVSLLGCVQPLNYLSFMWPKSDSVPLVIVLLQASGIYYTCSQEIKSLRFSKDLLGNI